MSVSPDLADEITSLNSIYQPSTLTLTSPPTQNPLSLTLTLPQTPISFSLLIPSTYPSSPPHIERIAHIDPSLPKGTGPRILQLSRTILQDLTTDLTGQVVFYELIESLEAQIANDNNDNDSDAAVAVVVAVPATATATAATSQHAPGEPKLTEFVPAWILAEPIVSHKSTFLARACAVGAPEEAGAAVRHLLATDKRAGKATHNMWAYRIGRKGMAGEVVYADADDDGEDGAGAKLAALLQVMGAWGVLVVVSRWYGGIKLGPERWRLIGSAGREAVVKGGQVGAWIVEKA